MKTPALTACLFLFAAPVSAVTLYRCDDGTRLSYTTERKPGCVVASTSSGPVAPPAEGSAPRPKAASRPTPADFPRVSSEAQKSRDTDRRKILEQEQAAEQRGLDDDRKVLGELETARSPAERTQPVRDRIALHERNLVALKKEIGNLK